MQARFHELVTEKIRATQAQIAELLAFASNYRPPLVGWPLQRPTNLRLGSARVWLRRMIGRSWSSSARARFGEVPIACTLQPGR